MTPTGRRRRTFAVGRIDRGATEVQWVRPLERAPMPGPWTLKAVVRDPRPRPALRVVR